MLDFFNIEKLAYNCMISIPDWPRLNYLNIDNRVLQVIGIYEG